MDRNKWLYGEPRLDDALNDPVVHRVMQRDGITEADVRAALAPVIDVLRARPPGSRQAA